MRLPAAIAASVLAVVTLGTATQALGQAPQAGGLTDHDVFLATSRNGLDWSRSGNPLIEHASVPDLTVTPRGRLRVYYVDSSKAPSTLECADVVRGRVRVLGCSIAGQPTPLALDPSIVRLDDGRYRLFYYSASEMGVGSNDPHPIRTAVSKDGIHFRDQGVAFTYPGLVDPDVFQAGKRWLMFVFSLTDGKTVVAKSKGGRRFAYAGPLSLQGWGTTGPVPLAGGRFRLYAFRQGDQRSISSFLSSNPLQWAQEPGMRLTARPGEEMTDPQVVRFKRGWRMVFKTSPTP